MDSSIFYENLRTRLSERIGPSGAQSLESLGLLDDVEIVKCGTPLDTVSHYLSKRLQLRKLIICSEYLIFHNISSTYIPSNVSNVAFLKIKMFSVILHF